MLRENTRTLAHDTLGAAQRADAIEEGRELA